MPPHDLPPRDPPRHPKGWGESEYPDEISRTESGQVSTSFAPETGRQLKFGAAVAAGVLALCLIIVSVVRILHAHSVAKSGEADYSAPPPVETVLARPV